MAFETDNPSGGKAFAWAARAVAIGLAAWLTGPAQGGLIDFETVPGGSPNDELDITTQYQSTQGVSFSLSGSGNPHLEAAGDADSGNGFLNDSRNAYDVADPGLESRLGDYFLRLGTGGLQTKPVPSLVIDYDNAVSAASGDIWDIDGHSQGDEQWRVEALDAGDSVLETDLSPRGTSHGANDSLDGENWVWSFNRSNDDIHGIRVSFVDDSGTKPDGIGLAFDNFSPTQPATEVPAPAPLALMGLGAGLWGLLRARRIPQA